MPVHTRYSSYLSDQTQFHDELITEDWNLYFDEKWDQTRRYEVAKLFRHIRPRIILDIGCGCGFHDVEMAGYPFVERVDSIDASRNSIIKAEETYSHPKVHRWQSRFQDLPADRCYDLVVSFQVFEHFDEPSTYLEKVSQLIKLDGHVAITTPNRLRIDNRLRVWRSQSEQMLSVMHYREYTLSEITAMASQHGLVREHSFGYGWHGIFDWLPHPAKLRLGTLLPFAAHGLGIIFRKMDGQSPLRSQAPIRDNATR